MAALSDRPRGVASLGQLAALDGDTSTAIAEALRAGEAEYRAVFRVLPGAIVMVFDADLRVASAGGGAFASHAMRPDELEGHTIWEVLAGRTCDAIVPHCRAAIAGRESAFDYTSTDGHCDYSVRIAPVRSGRGAVTGGVLLAHDITERARAVQPATTDAVAHEAGAPARIPAQSRAEELDALTGLPTSAPFRRRLLHEIVLASRSADAAALLIVEVDGVPAVASRHGQATADEVVRAAGAALAARLRATDHLGRLGPSRFGVVVVRAGDERATAVAGALADAVRGVRVSIAGDPIPITASIGMSALDSAVADPIAEAELALDRARSAGGDRYAVRERVVAAAPEPAPIVSHGAT
jgi:diguanylate cyclase (GGDEF)-like protein